MILSDSDPKMPGRTPRSGALNRLARGALGSRRLVLRLLLYYTILYYTRNLAAQLPGAAPLCTSMTASARQPEVLRQESFYTRSKHVKPPTSAAWSEPQNPKS